jgi:hypothetical protein
LFVYFILGRNFKLTAPKIQTVTMFFTVGPEALTEVVTRSCIFWDTIQNIDPFMFLTLNLKTILSTGCVGYRHTKFHMLNSNSSLAPTLRSSHEKETLNKSCVVLKDLLPIHNFRTVY